jgi:alkylhydroperoxidase family enzyme
LEVRAHTPFALKEGVTEAQLAALSDWQDSTLFGEKHRAVLEYADTVSRDVVVPQGLFDKVRGYFDEQEMVELTVTIGFYHLVARFIIAMEL